VPIKRQGSIDKPQINAFNPSQQILKINSNLPTDKNNPNFIPMPQGSKKAI
jgi:hypothetical protein